MAVIDTCESDFPNALAVYSGETLHGLDQVVPFTGPDDITRMTGLSECPNFRGG